MEVPKKEGVPGKQRVDESLGPGAVKLADHGQVGGVGGKLDGSGSVHCLEAHGHSKGHGGSEGRRLASIGKHGAATATATACGGDGGGGGGGDDGGGCDAVQLHVLCNHKDDLCHGLRPTRTARGASTEGGELLTSEPLLSSLPVVVLAPTIELVPPLHEQLRDGGSAVIGSIVQDGMLPDNLGQVELSHVEHV